MSKHTPGPWKHRKAGSAIHGEPGHEERFEYPAHIVSVIKDGQGRKVTRFVAECSSTTLPNEENARLISAAPDLLEALRDVLEDIDNLDMRNVLVARARTAIAKAEATK